MRIPCEWVNGEWNGSGQKQPGLLLQLDYVGGFGYAFVADSSGLIHHISTRKLRLKMDQVFSRQITAAVKP